MTEPNRRPPAPLGALRSARRDFLLRATRLGLRGLALAGTNEFISAALSRPFRLIHVVEYPKCGGSWLRNMLQSLRGGEAHTGEQLIRPGSIVQGHWVYRAWFPRPVVIVRDPRDVFVSYYYHETRYERREEQRSIDRYFRSDPKRPLREDFLAYLEAKLTHRTDPPFSYSEFLASWRSRRSVTWVRYEDLLENAERELTRVAAKVGLPTEEWMIRAAIERHSFEATTRRGGHERRRGEADPRSFERKGVAGDWRNHFGKRACELIDKHEGWALRDLGYEGDASWIEEFAAAQAGER